jgi:hypothetical protein
VALWLSFLPVVGLMPIRWRKMDCLEEVDVLRDKSFGFAPEALLEFEGTGSWAVVEVCLDRSPTAAEGRCDIFRTRRGATR